MKTFEKNKLISDRQKCAHEIRKGITCSRTAILGSNLCWQHNQNKVVKTIKAPKISLELGMLPNNALLNDKWKIIELIAKGGFGYVFKAMDVNSGEIVAIKTEHRVSSTSSINDEAYIYQSLHNNQLVPYMIYYGKAIMEVDGFDYTCVILVLQYAGESLRKLYDKEYFCLQKMATLIPQMIDTLEYFHNNGYIHRDIKPANFVIDEKNCVRLIDFGLAASWKDSSGNHIKCYNNVSFKGTYKYCSLSAHQLLTQSRKDDLESLLYVLIYFIRGELPWENMQGTKYEQRKKIEHMKAKITTKELTKDLPSAFKLFLDYIKTLRFSEQPQYSYLKSLFIGF